MQDHLLVVLNDVFLPSLLFIGIGALILVLVAYFVSKPTAKGWPLLILAFSFLGGVVGIFVGMSKTPVMGTVLPAVLTFITGLLAYLFGKENLAEWRPVIPNCIIAMMATVLFGSLMGSQVRGDYQQSEKEYKEWLLHYENVGLPVAKEAYLKIINGEGEDLDPCDFDPLIQLQQQKEQEKNQKQKVHSNQNNKETENQSTEDGCKPSEDDQNN